MTLAGCTPKMKYADISIIPKNNFIGKIQLNTTYNLDVIINNPSETNLHIMGVVPSCQCTITEEKTFIIPKKSMDTLRIVYKPTKLGMHTETITIKSNTDPPFNTFLIQAEVMSNTP